MPRSGDQLTIDTRQGPTLKGRLVSKAADALVLDIGGREQPVPLGDIDRVRRRRNGVVASARLRTSQSEAAEPAEAHAVIVIARLRATRFGDAASA